MVCPYFIDNWDVLSLQCLMFLFFVHTDDILAIVNGICQDCYLNAWTRLFTNHMVHGVTTIIFLPSFSDESYQLIFHYYRFSNLLDYFPKTMVSYRDAYMATHAINLVTLDCPCKDSILFCSVLSPFNSFVFSNVRNKRRGVNCLC